MLLRDGMGWDGGPYRRSPRANAMYASPPLYTSNRSENNNEEGGSGHLETRDRGTQE